MSRDRNFTRNRNKLTIAVVAGTLAVASGASTASASTAFTTLNYQNHQSHQQATPAGHGSPESVARKLLASFGWSSRQFSCLEPLWAHESGWNVSAANPSTGAYGIPQADPGSKMASAGPHWRSDAATQIKWGLTYIKDTYRSPCGAWAHEQADDWY